MKKDIMYNLLLIASWLAIVVLGSRVEQINSTVRSIMQKQDRFESRFNHILTDGGM